MKKILVASFILFSLVCKGQDSTVKSSLIFTSSPVYFDSVFVGSTELIYAPGISWTESDNQDSIIKIQIEGDTMMAIRNLLVYCLQEKDEADNGTMVLSNINLNILKKMFNSKYFNIEVAEYRKTILKNKKERLKKFGKFGVLK